MSSATDVSPFDRTYGLALTHCDPELVEAHVPVEERVTQVSGLVHGGVYAAMAETLASLGTNSAVNRDGHLGVGSSNQTSFLRPIVDGRIRGRAFPLHRGRTTWVWDVEFRDDRDRLCAVSRVTVTVRRAAEAGAHTGPR